MARRSDALAGFACSAFIAFTGVASAMQIPQYQKMAEVDQRDYTVALVEGAIKALNAHGQPDQAQNVTTFFLDKSANGGFAQLEKNVGIMKSLNQQNAANPNNKNPIYEVEHAFGVTLKNNGISVPISVLLAINKDFKPKVPAGVSPNQSP